MTSTAPTLNGSASAPPAEYFVADLFLEALQEAGVDYLFTVLGSDHPSIIEAYIRRQNAGQAFPKMLLFQHEFVAMSAADAYGRMTGKAQCVIVHVDVGTAALGQGLHNASSGKAPVLIFSGQAPLTLYGELAGSRTEHVQWYQDVHGQHNIVAPFSRYSNEIKVAENTKLMVNRAILMAVTGNPGPTYLTATREVLATPVSTKLRDTPRKPQPSSKLGGVPQDAVERIGDALLSAERPLVVTGYLGRNHGAVRGLVKLANTVKGLQVFDFEFREMSFPADHRAWITRATGAAPATKAADTILVLDADVPWIPTKVKPSENATIFHIDLDSRKEQMTLFDIHATETYNADTAIALEQLNTYIAGHQKLIQSADFFASRWEALGASHSEGLKTLTARAVPSSDGSISVSHFYATLRHLLPKDTIYVNDVVTNQALLSEQLLLKDPGTNLTKGGSGLGWAGGAGIGAKLATEMYDLSDRPNIKRRSKSTLDAHAVTSTKQNGATPLSTATTEETPSSDSPFICSLTGDGSFMFSAPSSVYWAQYRLQTPFLTIVINNGGWKATRSCLNDVHPGGLGIATSDAGLGIDLKDDGPDYVGIAVAAAGDKGRLLGLRVQESKDLTSVLEQAITWVQEEKRGAIVEVVVS